MEIIIILSALSLAALIAILTKRRGLMEFVSIAASLAALVAAFSIAGQVAGSGEYAPYAIFSIDALGALLMLIIACIGLSAVVYSIPYFRRETAKNIIGSGRVKQYFVLFNLFMGVMFLALATASPIIAWIAIEATTLSTASLISFYNKPSAVEGAWKYLILNSVGLLLGFFGTLLYFTAFSAAPEAGLATWHGLLASVSQIDPAITKIAFIFILIGYGTKVGFVPMHTWKPDAYSKAPAPLGALFSGALFPVAFFVLLKFKLITDSAVGPAFSQNLFLAFGLLSIAVPALIMLVLKNYKRLLAYSSIENAGVIALGFGWGGLGSVAAILHMLYHSLVKSALFFLSGNFLLKYHSAKIASVKGALAALPATSILFIAGFLITTGAPPLGMFLTKMLIFSVGIKIHPAIAILAMIMTAIIFIGFLKHVSDMILGAKPAEIKAGEEGAWLIIPPLVLLGLVLYLSFSQPSWLQILIHNAAARY